MPEDPAIVASLVSAVVALITAAITAWVTVGVQKTRLQAEFQLQEARLRTELKLEFAAETAIRELLSREKWKLRSFKEIEKRLKGFDKDDLRKALIRSGALSFESSADSAHDEDEDNELWGLRERNADKL